MIAQNALMTMNEKLRFGNCSRLATQWVGARTWPEPTSPQDKIQGPARRIVSQIRGVPRLGAALKMSTIRLRREPGLRCWRAVLQVIHTTDWHIPWRNLPPRDVKYSIFSGGAKLTSLLAEWKSNVLATNWLNEGIMEQGEYAGGEGVRQIDVSGKGQRLAATGVKFIIDRVSAPALESLSLDSHHPFFLFQTRQFADWKTTRSKNLKPLSQQ